jgi:colanic acid/amylovoran biosynthesis glycosyltransferase
MKRIVLVVPAFPKLSETFIAAKARALLERGWDLHVVCDRSDPAEWARFPELQGYRDLRRRVHVVPPYRPRWLAALRAPAVLGRTLLANPRGSVRYLAAGRQAFGADVVRRFYLDAALVALQPDIIHFEFGALAAGRMHLKSLLHCAIVASFRGYDLNYVGLDDPDYYRDVWKHADAVHVLGDDLWRRARARGCPPDKRRATIAPAVDADFFVPKRDYQPAMLGTAERPLRILSVGRLEWKKGYEYALQAVRRLIDASVCCEYRIIGDGEYLEAVAFARHQLGLEQAVILAGAQLPAAVKQAMTWADVLLHAAVSEGFCNAVLEAQAMALPVVCTDADGLPENVADGITGLVVPRRDSAALAEKLALLAHDPAARERMSQAGRARVRRQFRPSDQIAAFERLYHDVLETPPGSVASHPKHVEAS